jgi:hypothetical protein
MNWIVKSCYGDVRKFELLEPSILKVTYDDCLYNFSDIYIDANGGPFLGVSGKLFYEDQTMTITKILSHKKINNKLVVMLEVKLD